MCGAHRHLDPVLTTVAANAITNSAVMLGEYLFAAIGPANARTSTNNESAVRCLELTHEYAANGVLREYTPSLAAIALLGRLEEIDWLAVVEAVLGAAQPRHRSVRRRVRPGRCT